MKKIFLLFLFGLINCTITSENHKRMTQYGTFNLTLGPPIDLQDSSPSIEDLQDCWNANDLGLPYDLQDSKGKRICNIAYSHSSTTRKQKLLQLLSKATAEDWNQVYIDFIEEKLKQLK
jgi:hypothetical protein